MVSWSLAVRLLWKQGMENTNVIHKKLIRPKYPCYLHFSMFSTIFCSFDAACCIECAYFHNLPGIFTASVARNSFWYPTRGCRIKDPYIDWVFIHYMSIEHYNATTEYDYDYIKPNDIDLHTLKSYTVLCTFGNLFATLCCN